MDLSFQPSPALSLSPATCGSSTVSDSTSPEVATRKVEQGQIATTVGLLKVTEVSSSPKLPVPRQRKGRRRATKMPDMNEFMGLDYDSDFDDCPLTRKVCTSKCHILLYFMPAFT